MATNVANKQLERARDMNTLPRKLHELSLSHDPEIRLAVASNPATSTYTLRDIIARESKETQSHEYDTIDMNSEGHYISKVHKVAKDGRVLNAARRNLKNRLLEAIDPDTPLQIVKSLLRDDHDREVSDRAAFNIVSRLLSGSAR